MKKVLILFLVLMSFSSWKWKELSLKSSDPPELLVQTHWVVDTVQEQGLRKNLAGYNSPLVTEERVIVGNFIDGVKAYDKKRGTLIWNFSIPSAGVSKPLVLHEGTLYFGGRDGFFYSLDEKTGTLKWKYYIGSELAGQALVKENRIYFLTQDQKLYALDLEGNLIWIHSHSVLNHGFFMRGNMSPLVQGDLIYSPFQDGVMKALKVKDVSLVWLSRPSSEPITLPLRLSQKCLFVSFFESYNYCLNPKNGKVLSKSELPSSFEFEDSSHSYLFYKGALFAYSKEKSDKKSFSTQTAFKSFSSKGDQKILWQKKLASSYPFPPVLFKKYLIYGFPSFGKLQILKNENGQLVKEHPFGKGLAGPISMDPIDKSLYFLSVSSYLYKISLLESL